LQFSVRQPQISDCKISIENISDFYFELSISHIARVEKIYNLLVQCISLHKEIAL